MRSILEFKPFSLSLSFLSSCLFTDLWLDSLDDSLEVMKNFMAQKFEAFEVKYFCFKKHVISSHSWKLSIPFKHLPRFPIFSSCSYTPLPYQLSKSFDILPILSIFSFLDLYHHCWWFYDICLYKFVPRNPTWYEIYIKIQSFDISHLTFLAFPPVDSLCQNSLMISLSHMFICHLS